MSSSAPTSPRTSPAPGSGLSREELAERELREMMDASPVSSNGLQGLGEDDMDALDLDDPHGGGLTVSATISSTPATSIRQDIVTARRKVVQLKLHPYQRDSVEEFIKASSTLCQLLLFIQLCAVENQILNLKSAAAPFVSSPPLLENIKSFVIGVLLSSKLSAYKGAVPVDLVMVIISSVPRSYVPENLASDSFAFKVVKTDVQEELTQCRAKIKKALKDSLAAPLPKDCDSIFDLATAIVANSKSSVTVPLCARLALLRKVYVESADSKFWDKVDARLLLIRNTADGDAHKITKAFDRILKADRNTYGDNGTYMLLDGDTDAFQTSVDVVIGAN